MPKVYVVLHGERCEGGSILAVHKNKKNAIATALKVKCCFNGGWAKDDDLENYWTNECDFVTVEEHKILP